MKRQSWDEYFMTQALHVATRSTCTRLSVGTVLVKDKNVIATGYNGSISGAPHCIDAGCNVHNNHCIATIHSEVNAILQAAKNGVSPQFATAYVTHSPCLECYKVLYQVGIKRIVYNKAYRLPDYNIFGISDNRSPEIVQLTLDIAKNDI